MQISFFEEYPTQNNLSKLRLISFQTNLYIASHNVNEFIALKRRVKRNYTNVNKIIYWPILEVSEGYWMSAFSKINAIERILNELANAQDNFPVLWDAELPLLNKKLFFTQLFHLFENRRIINQVMQKPSKNHPLIVTAFPRFGINKFLHTLACTFFDFGNFHYIDMLYTSLLRENSKDKEIYLRNVIRDSKERFKEYSVGLGLIGRGVEDHTTPLILHGDLARDLLVAKEEGIKEVVLYRLGGVNDEYMQVLKKFV